MKPNFPAGWTHHGEAYLAQAWPERYQDRQNNLPQSSDSSYDEQPANMAPIHPLLPHMRDLNEAEEQDVIRRFCARLRRDRQANLDAQENLIACNQILDTNQAPHEAISPYTGRVNKKDAIADAGSSLTANEPTIGGDIANECDRRSMIMNAKLNESFKLATNNSERNDKGELIKTERFTDENSTRPRSSSVCKVKKNTRVDALQRGKHNSKSRNGLKMKTPIRKVPKERERSIRANRGNQGIAALPTGAPGAGSSRRERSGNRAGVDRSNREVRAGGRTERRKGGDRYTDGQRDSQRRDTTHFDRRSDGHLDVGSFGSRDTPFESRHHARSNFHYDGGFDGRN